MEKRDPWTESAISGRPGPTPPPIEGITREPGGSHIETRPEVSRASNEGHTEERPQTRESVGRAAKEQVKTMAERRKERTSERLGSVAKALRDAGRQLRGQDQRTAAVVTEKIADRIERLSGKFRSKDVEEIAGDVERAVRQRPALAFGVALVAGFFLVRMLRNSG
jgi:hypothetical protein